MNTYTAAEKAQVSVSTIRRWCRTGHIQAAKIERRWVVEPASLLIKEDRMQYELVTGTAHSGGTLYVARHVATGQDVDDSRDREAMVARVAQLNAGQAMVVWARQFAPQRIDTRPGPTCPSCGLRHHEGDC